MRSRLRVLAHPAFTGCVAVLAVNDHFLKQAWPGWFTGKLSDFAGLAVVAVLTAVVLDRIRPAIALAGLGFAAIKLSSAGAALAAPVLGGVTAQDPTDLVALLVLWPVDVFLRRFEISHGPPYGRALLGVAGACVAVTSISATSCREPHVVQTFYVNGDLVYAEIPRDPAGATPPQGAVDWAVSRDGGETWAASGAPDLARPDDRDEACTTDGPCYRVVPGARVEERLRGEWITAFRFTEEETRRLHLRNRGCAVPPARDLYRSVVALDVGGRDHVVVAMGTQGVLHRSPDGRWERVAVLDLEPSPLWGPSWLSGLRWAPLVLVGLAPLSLIAGRLSGRARKAAHFAIVFAIGGAAVLFGGGLLAVLGPIADYAIFGPVLTVASLLVFVFSVVAYRRGQLWPRRSNASSDSERQKDPQEEAP
jgi:hypothetical protein